MCRGTTPSPTALGPGNGFQQKRNGKWRADQGKNKGLPRKHTQTHDTHTPTHSLFQQTISSCFLNLSFSIHWCWSAVFIDGVEPSSVPTLKLQWLSLQAVFCFIGPQCVNAPASTYSKRDLVSTRRV